MDGAGDGDWGQGCGENCFTLDGDGFICHRVLDAPEVWRVELLMHDTFLPSVNAFVVRDGGETLVVDSGTPDDFNDTRLMRALLGLGVDPEGATVFFTHAHIDHTGLARELSEAGARLVVPEGVLADMRRFAVPAWREAMAARLRAEGFGAAESDELADVIWDHSRNFEAELIPFETVPAGGTLACGGLSLEVVPTSGHTPGQCALWSRRSRAAFLGDAVLFLCSTTIGFGEGDDPIAEQVLTLRAFAARGVEHAFMGHGLQGGEFAKRCSPTLPITSAAAPAPWRPSGGAWADGLRAGPGDGMARPVRPLVRDPGAHAVVPRLRERGAPRPSRGDGRRPPRARRSRREPLLCRRAVGRGGVP